MSLPHATWLSTFEAAARHSSFTAAADELGLTPAAVSQQIRHLEGHLGVRLFERLPRGVVLSDIGQAYAQPVQRAFRDLQVATNGLFDAPRRPVLKVRASISCAALVIAPRLAEFRELHPDIEVALSTFVWADRFETENSDIDVRWGYGDWPEDSILHLGHENAVLVCNPRSAAANGDLQKIADDPVYRMTGLEHDWSRLAEHFDLDLPQPKCLFRVDSSMIALLAISSNPGAVIVLESFARAFLDNGQLVSPFPFRLPVARSHFIVHRKGVETRGDVIAFTRWMASLYATDPVRQGHSETMPQHPD